MAAPPQHHRVILHLHQGAPERAIARVAAELAHLLGLELHGVFLTEQALPDLAALPFIREFRLTTGAWQKFDRERIADEQRAAAGAARRLFEEVAGALGVVRLFDVVTGDPALFIPATSQAGDVIVVGQPRLPAERLVHATAHWLQAAHACAASVLLVPETPARQQGPVAAVVCVGSDPALRIAAQIAAAAGETLLLLVHGTPDLARDAAAQARSSGLASRLLELRTIAGVSPEIVLEALGTAGERLVVLTRGACGADDAAISAHIAASRGVPVLVVEP